jgi:hypothetical protein
MYFSALKRLIGSVEEKVFYDVALIFLESQGYRGLSIVDGSGDGGRDVICSRTDLRIQLSVRRDWQTKVNNEAATALAAGKRHLVYITNRLISPEAEAAFLTNDFKLAGEVDVSIYDLNYISTTLTHSSLVTRAYGTLGADPDFNLQPTPREVALSSLLLFGVEAQDLRNAVIEANIKATLLDNEEALSEQELIEQVVDSLPGANIARLIGQSISRLRTQGVISGPSKSVGLSTVERERLTTARNNFNQSLCGDIEELKKVSGLDKNSSLRLISMARNLLVTGRELEGSGDAEEEFRSFIAQNQLRSKRNEIYECLSSLTTIRQFQFGTTVDSIFKTNTFDIYRALGGRTNLTMVLDSNVALPLILGLEFPNDQSRYGQAVLSLNEVCRQHGITMMAPSVYVNEMAGHGRKALEYLEVYPELPNEAKSALRNSRNAFLSHYSYIREDVSIKLDEYLSHFGIVPGASVRKIENRILSILESHSITTGFSEWYDNRVRIEIEAHKNNELRLLVDHDAAVATNLINDSTKGYIVATWDNVMIDVVQDLARVFVDNPARVNDFLAVIEGQFGSTYRSEAMLFTLLHMDDEAAQKLAKKIEEVNSVEGAFRLKAIVDEARRRRGIKELSEDEMAEILVSDA